MNYTSISFLFTYLMLKDNLNNFKIRIQPTKNVIQINKYYLKHINEPFNVY